ncbi:MAG: hypothetical protein ACTSRU_07650 [Candidatus Hodarchaeales archaeon]
MMKVQNTIKSESLVVYGTGISITLLAAIYFLINGFPTVITATGIMEGVITPPLYMIPVLFLYGILIGELLNSMVANENKTLLTIQSIEICTVGFFSFIRYVTGVPFSGHGIITLFYLLHQSLTRENKRYIRIIAGIAVLIVTVIYKIFAWNDPITLLLGVSLGTVLWAPGYFYRKKTNQLITSDQSKRA